MSDSINLGFSVLGSASKAQSQLPKNKNPDRSFIQNRIQSLDIVDSIKEELIRRLYSYPDGALNSFWNNLPGVIETLKTKRAKGEEL